MKKLLKAALTFKVGDEAEAAQVIEDFKSKQIPEGYTLTKYKSDYKCRKARSGENKGQIEEEWYIVVVEKSYEE